MTSFKPEYLELPFSFRSDVGKFFSVKDNTVNIIDFASHFIFVATTQLCHYSVKTATRQYKNDGYGCISKTLYKRVSHIWSIPNLDENILPGNKMDH